MKRILLLAIMILTGSMIILSQVPQAMTYKAIAKDEWGVALPSKTITLRFSILEGSDIGATVYQETHSTTTNKFGLMDVEIGKGTPVIGSFETIDWSTGVYFIKIEMDPKGGTEFRLEDSAHQLLSVPYAFYAGNAGGVVTELDPVFTLSPAAIILNGDITNWNAAFNWGNHALQGYLTTELDGSTTNELQNLSQVLNTGNGGGGIIIKNIADPVDNQDAATKAYVDALEARINALEADIEGLTDKDGDGYKVGQGDCNDDDPAINPTAYEVYNGTDDNCNGTIDEGYVCTSIDPEPNDLISTPLDLGMLPDFAHETVTANGNAKNPYDEDWYRFYAYDSEESTNPDSYTVKLLFLSNGGGEWVFDVFINNNIMAQDVETYVENSTSGNDSKYFIIKVHRRVAGGVNQCVPYTLKISNGV